MKIGAYLIDPVHSEKGETADVKEMEREYGVVFEETDIAPGFSLPALLTWVATDGWPYLTAAIPLFLAGKPIKDNLEAWPALARRLLNIFKGRPPVLDRHGAAVVAVNAVIKQTSPTTIVLLGYACRS